MSEILLETKDLTKQFGHHKAVDNVNVHIKKGSIYGFIGRNGAGKTTFLKMISGLSGPTRGEVHLFGYTGKDLCRVRSRIGCLIEAPGLYGNMSAYDNLMIKCKLMGIKKSGYIEELLEQIGLADAGNKKTKKFSLGMKQRLGIGLALVGEPDLLVLDEPINGLDPQGIAEVRDIILKLQKAEYDRFDFQSHSGGIIENSHSLWYYPQRLSVAGNDKGRSDEPLQRADRNINESSGTGHTGSG